MTNSRHRQSTDLIAARIGLVMVLLCLLLAIPSRARAQDDAQIVLSAPEVEQYPLISTTFDARDPYGAFIKNLQPSQVTVLEDDQPLKADSLEQVRSGVRFIYAINAGGQLAVRNSVGMARIDPINDALQAWAGRELQRQVSDDDYSFVTNQGAQATFASGIDEWLSAQIDYRPDYRKSTPSADSLVTALQLAAEPLPQEGMKAMVLYVTPPPLDDSLLALRQLVEDPDGIRVPVHIWLVGPAGAVDTPGAAALRDLAAASGGSFLMFTGAELLPEVDSYLEPLRTLYTLTYASAITSAGTHTLALEIKTGDTSFRSQTVSFEFDITPPNPMFVSPPMEIRRISPADSAAPVQDLAPRRQPLKIMVEFADGHPRPLVAARLFVDGELVTENKEAPFDNFIWDISDYVESGRHTLRVEVEDSLGLTASTIEVPVNVAVVLPEPDPLDTLAANNTWIASAAALLAGGVLVAVLLAGWRLRHRTVSRRTAEGEMVEESPVDARRASKDPLTQPVKPRTDGNKSADGWSQRMTVPRRGQSQPGGSYFLRLDDDLHPQASAPLPLSGKEMTVGRDPTQATIVLDFPSVEGLHARLRLEADGSSYLLLDQGSVAGTWVNYVPVARAGARLTHGDVVHFGRVAFRFEESKPQQPRKPQVKSYKESL